ncbi:ComEC/Rec2 family competence protein [Sphingomonas jatrophae]|uniref:Competence protein ComEC n=1 Tax=Sphingomonas jatrophae TaxID=1166337 RepID=A0A1I6JV74_9SPHN|nr:ComEC/Rec2 family competence protein [Sphingomonas jatrophae]SFR82788.1 competence protein ComEC [Sphingomonas jatrophae]
MERDQLPLWLPIGLGAGIAAWFALPDPARWAGWMLGAGGLAAMLAVLGQGTRASRALAILLLVAAFGCGLVWWRSQSVAAPVLGRTVVAAFAATVETVEPLPARDAVRVLLAPDPGQGLPPRLRVSFAAADVPAGLAPTARLSLRARLVPPPPAALPGAYNFSRIAWFRGVGASGRAFPGATLIAPAAKPGPAARLADLRARLSAHIQSRLPGASGGVAAALATGDQGAIPDDAAEAMRRSGLAHLLSISGLHVTAVTAAAMLLVLRLLALSPALALRWNLPLVAAGAGACAAVAYTLLSGAEVPTIRSCIAAVLVLAALALGREAMTLRLVAAGALVVLLLWPESLVGASFQLSFAAIVAIVALHDSPRVRGWFIRREEALPRRIARALGSLLLTGLVVELALMPIALWHFHRAGLYGALANIVAIPLSTFVAMPLEAAALIFDTIGLGGPFWWAGGKALDLLLWIARTVAAAPGASRMLPSMPAGAFGAMVSGGLWLALWRTRVRLLGLAPILIGVAWAASARPPDLLVTGDGRHVALRGDEGGLALLRPRAGDYVRDLLGEAAAIDGEAAAFDDWPGARCGRDLCTAAIRRGGRTWHLLATRSAYRVEWGAFTRARAAADIVVSDRRLPRGCKPRWLKADAALLRTTGGLALGFDPLRVAVVRTGGRHPWEVPPVAVHPPRARVAPKPRE